MHDVSKKTEAAVRKVGDKAIDLQSASAQHVNKHLRKRAKGLAGSKRFIIGWLGLVSLLCLLALVNIWQVSSRASVAVPTGGGVYSEGLLGESDNLNPLFSGGAVDDSATKLVFNGLLRHNEAGELVGDLAKSIKVEDNKKVYTVTLRDNVKWHDGQDFTADDVVYTVQTIQNPVTRANSYASWKDVKVVARSKYEVAFELPAPFAPFPDSLTLQILPKHLLSEIGPDKLRTSSFNNAPVGTGPFAFQALRREAGGQQQLEFVKNEAYYRGEPRVDKFVLKTFKDESSLKRALSNREITAAVDLKDAAVESLSNDKSIRIADVTLNSAVFAFLKTTAPQLGQVEVRQALVNSYNRQHLIGLFNARYLPIKSAILPTQLGYDARFNQTTNQQEATRLLDAAGWVLQPDGFRKKDGQVLELSLATVNNAQYSAVAEDIQKQWSAVGVKTKIDLLSAEQLQQTAIAAHGYDVLLYQVSLGNDPDQYVYWHSSQARAGGLNFSEWKSSRADSALDVARTRLEDVLRTARYQTFQDEWQKGAPALALYQPRVAYAYHQNASGYKGSVANAAADRLSSVELWTVNTKKVHETP